MTIYQFNVDHSNPQDRKRRYESGKEMKFDFKQKGRKCPRDTFLISVFYSPAIMASGISIRLSPENPDKYVIE